MKEWISQEQKNLLKEKYNIKDYDKYVILYVCLTNMIWKGERQTAFRYSVPLSGEELVEEYLTNINLKYPVGNEGWSEWEPYHVQKLEIN